MIQINSKVLNMSSLSVVWNWKVVIVICLNYDQLCWSLPNNYSNIIQFTSSPFPLTVEVQPIPPVIIYGGNVVEVDEGQLVTLECQSRGRPAPRLKWLDGFHKVIETGIKTQETGNAVTSISSFLTFTADRRHNNKLIKCMMEGRSKNISTQIGMIPWSDTIPVHVQYKPHLNICISQESLSFSEPGSADGSSCTGDSLGNILVLKGDLDELIITCTADANPSIYGLWTLHFVDETVFIVTSAATATAIANLTDFGLRYEVVEERRGDFEAVSILTLFGVIEELNNTLVTCEGANDVGGSEANVILSIPYDQSVSAQDIKKSLVDRKLGLGLSLLLLVIGVAVGVLILVPSMAPFVVCYWIYKLRHRGVYYVNGH